MGYQIIKLFVMTNREIAQKVIDFQFSRTHIKDQISREREDEQTQLVKFTDWNLQNVMHELGLRDPAKYKIKWIGFEQHKFTDAFLYCLFKGCRSGFAAKNGIFIKLKYCLYQMACKYIKIGDQKNLVEVLCGAQYAKNLSSFLNRNPMFLKLFNKLLRSYFDSQKETTRWSQLYKLQQFSDNFDFIKFRIVNENIGQLLHFDEKFYIIYEKQCCFVIQVQKQKQGLLKLNKVMESDRENELITIRQIRNENPEQKKHDDKQKGKNKGYTVPQFILMNNQKKHKKSVRYTEIEIQQDLLAQFRGIPLNHKITMLDPALMSRVDHIISQQTIPQFSDIRGSLQPFKSIQQYPEQNKRRDRTQKNILKFPKNASMRCKTGFFEQNKGKLANRSKSKSPHDVTIDQKAFKKPQLKKIELSLKKLITPNSKMKDHNSGEYSPFRSTIYNEKSPPYPNSNSFQKRQTLSFLNGE